MEIVLFTATAIILYVAADWILQRLEVRAGRRFENRSLVFLGILMALALSTFYLIRQLA